MKSFGYFMAIKKYDMVWGPMVINVLGPIDFCTFNSSKQQPDAMQPQLDTTTFFLSCVKLVYCYTKLYSSSWFCFLCVFHSCVCLCFMYVAFLVFFITTQIAWDKFESVFCYVAIHDNAWDILGFRFKFLHYIV